MAAGTPACGRGSVTRASERLSALPISGTPRPIRRRMAKTTTAMERQPRAPIPTKRRHASLLRAMR